MGLVDRLLGCYRPHPDKASIGSWSAQSSVNLPTTYGGYDPQLGWGSPDRMPQTCDPSRWHNLRSWTGQPAPTITALPMPHSQAEATGMPETVEAPVPWWCNPTRPTYPVWVPYMPPPGVDATDASHHPQPPSPEHQPMYLHDYELRGWLAPKPTYMRMDEYIVSISRGMHG